MKREKDKEDQSFSPKNTVILLDTGPLWLLANKSCRDKNKERAIFECNRWAKLLINNQYIICIPEIADYETRRSIMRENKLPAVKRLDSLKLVKGFEYIPITTEIMETASEFWAWARVTGQQTASDDSLDGDVILAATAKTMSMKARTVVISTTNVGHLQRYHTYTKDWRDNDWHNLKEAKF